MSQLSPVALALAATVAVTSAQNPAARYSIRSLPPLSGDLESAPSSIDDAYRVVGVSGTDRGFTWTSASSVSTPLLGPANEPTTRAVALGPGGRTVGATASGIGEHATSWWLDAPTPIVGQSLVAVPLAPLSIAVAVNSSGMAAGWYDDFIAPRPAVFGLGPNGDGSVYLPLPTHLVEGLALDIDEAGTIVGFGAPFGPTEALRWDPSPGGWQPSVLQPLTPGGAAAAIAHAGPGAIVGHAFAPDGWSHLVTWTPLGPIDLGAPFGAHAYARGASGPAGLVVGYAIDATLSRRAIVKGVGSPASIEPLDLSQVLPTGTPWGTLLEATDVNGHGAIVGIGELGGVVRAFLMTPIRRTLTVPQTVAAGAPVSVTVLGAAPGTRLELFLARGPGETILPGRVQSLDLANARAVARAVADTQGVAAMTVPPVHLVTGATLWFQAFDRDAGEVTEVAVRVVP